MSDDTNKLEGKYVFIRDSEGRVAGEWPIFFCMSEHDYSLPDGNEGPFCNIMSPSGNMTSIQRKFLVEAVKATRVLSVGFENLKVESTDSPPYKGD